jgi:hypothetical protein
MLYNPPALGRRLAEAMKAAGVRNTDLAKQCDVTDQAVRGWVRTGRIAYRHFPEICDLLKCSIEWLATGKEPRPEASLAAAHLNLRTLRLAWKFQSLPGHSRVAIEKVVDLATKSARWDERQRRKTR